MQLSISKKHSTRYQVENNNERLDKQKQNPIFAIMGNPPYSVGAKNENENTKNEIYPILNNRIKETYGKYSTSKSIRGVYDSYMKAFRWASDRVKDKGIISFISNGSFIDTASTDGVRASWIKEFNYIYVLNLRGDARTSGEQRKKEAGNIFDSGSRTPIAITFLVKDGSSNHEIYYHDIGDYLSREQKLQIISEARSIKGIEWQRITPNENNDWINQRDKKYESFSSILGDIFITKQDGIQSNRDSWVYNFSSSETLHNAERMIENYNNEVTRLSNLTNEEKISKINTSETYISWSRALKNKLMKSTFIEKKGYLAIKESMYYPFVKKHIYYHKDIIEYPRKFDETLSAENLMISVSGIGTNKGFATFITNIAPNYNMLDKGRHFEILANKKDQSLFEIKTNISEKACLKYNLNDRELYNYIYAILHSDEFREKYQNNLVKDLPRIPNVSNKAQFIDIGKKLIHLHLNYEKVDAYDDLDIEYKKINCSYRVQKMKFFKKDRKDTIIFNNDITIRNIPEKAYNYIINGKSAIDWIVDQYQVTTDKKSGIIDDPNEYSDDPKYIFNLLLSIINVSVQTVDLVNSLPKMEIIEE